MRIIYYTTLCGCVKVRDQLIHGPSSINRKLLCPEHMVGLASKFSFCEVCGKKIEYNTPQSKIPLRCYDCDPVRKKKKEYKLRQKERLQILAPEEDLIKVLSERSGCVYRPLCVEVNIKKRRLPCFNCEEYKEKNALSVLVYGLDLAELDNFIKSIHKFNDQEAALCDFGEKRWGDIFKKRKKDIGFESDKL